MSQPSRSLATRAVEDLPPLRPGKTPFHENPEADDIYRLLAMAYMDARNPLGLSQMKDMLSVEFPTLEVTEGQIRYFLDHYVEDAAVLAMAPWMRRGILRANVDLNPAKDIAEVADSMVRRVKALEATEAVGRVNYDDNGRAFPVGPTEVEFSKMQKAAIEAKEAQMDAFARLGMMPERKGPPPVVVATQVNVDLSASSSGLFRGYTRTEGASSATGSTGKEPLDADFKARGGAEARGEVGSGA